MRNLQYKLIHVDFRSWSVEWQLIDWNLWVNFFYLGWFSHVALPFFHRETASFHHEDVEAALNFNSIPKFLGLRFPAHYLVFSEEVGNVKAQIFISCTICWHVVSRRKQHERFIDSWLCEFREKYGVNCRRTSWGLQETWRGSMKWGRVHPTASFMFPK